MDVEKLVDKFGTRNPFKIAKEMNIVVIFEPLGEINGYFTTVFRQRQIHINCNLSEQQKLFTAAHELGHAVLHPKANTPFLKGSTFFSVNKLEKEANKFALMLLISDEDLNEFKDFTLQQLSCIFGYPEEFMMQRIK